MKDSQGKTIHVGDIVTLNHTAKPRYLVGKFAKVAGYGEIRLKLGPIDGDRQSIKKELRLEASMLVVGKHTIANPLFHDEQRAIESYETFRNLLWLVLSHAEDNEVISPDQLDQLLDTYDQMWLKESRNESM